jgi:benzoyl-CoA reductase subunit D
MSMIAAGLDMGAKTIKALILKDGEIVGRAVGLAGLEQRENAEKVLGEALSAAGIERDDVEKWCATGAGRAYTPVEGEEVTEVTAAARGVCLRYPHAKTVIDVGAEEGRAIRVEETGKVIDFAINEKCAAGAGAFTEAMSRALEVKLEELGSLSLESTKHIPMNAQCTVFAESEVVTLVHQKTPKEDIARAVHDAIADRIVSMARKVGAEPDIVLIGGMAFNVGFVESLKHKLEVDDLIIPDDPEFLGAHGAALIAVER